MVDFTEDFLTDGAIDNASSLVQVIACQQTGDKSLPQITMTQFLWYIYALWGINLLIM